jgi:prolyl-tRNA synthetase
MKYSQLFGKTLRTPPKDAVLPSHKLLFQAGFIRESTAGRYYFLPLGWRVHEKIKAIIKQEMDKTGAQEMIAPVLHPLSLWQETNRTASVGFELMTIKDGREFQFALGGTAEEMFVDLVRKMGLSYRDLPFNIYQFSTKFRDEKRARGGLLRVREFVMKDAYSFDRNETEFKKVYKLMGETYAKIFQKLGLSTIKVEADNGYIGGEYCHEFQVESENGEGRFFVSEDGNYAAHEDVAGFKRQEISMDEPIKKMEIVKQPKWVETMDDNIKHYKLPLGRFIKNVVFRNKTTKEIIIAVIRGDLEINKTKLEHVLDAVGQLETATAEDLVRIGTKAGYVHSWGYKEARYIGDISLTLVRNMIGGQKEDETDSINVNYGRDFTCEIIADIAMAKDGFLTDDGNSRLIAKKGIEVGNIFQLGLHYTKLMKDATFIDESGKEIPYYMGCYGIGLGRTMAAIVEKYHDDKGIIWPESVAPYQVHLIDLRTKDEGRRTKEIIEKLEQAGVEVLWDDRENVSAGEKFADADLIGIPRRAVVSPRLGEKIELKSRKSGKVEILTLEQLISKLKN